LVPQQEEGLQCWLVLTGCHRHP
ncbi:hypothetical protein BAE44_0002385, partial [Dichanthelium oligosanthes]